MRWLWRLLSTKKMETPIAELKRDAWKQTDEEKDMYTRWRRRALATVPATAWQNESHS